MNDRRICLVLHDVAPATWPQCRRILETLTAIDHVPVTLLAVPRYHGAGRDAAFENWLVGRAAAGDEIALHGYTHLDDQPASGLVDWFQRSVYTRGEGEFSRLPFDEAKQRIGAGLAWLRSIGIEPAGFVAPAWLLGEPAWHALWEHGHAFRYTCTLRRIHLLHEMRSVECQSQVFSTSTWWRRGASVAWNHALQRWQHDQPVVRLELHPNDSAHKGVQRAWQRLATEQLRTRRACTLEALVQELKTAPAPQTP